MNAQVVSVKLPFHGISSLPFETCLLAAISPQIVDQLPAPAAELSMTALTSVQSSKRLNWIAESLPLADERDPALRQIKRRSSILLIAAASRRTTGKPLHRSGPSSANVPIITWPPERTARKTRST
jgi:hypothetical protein